MATFNYNGKKISYKPEILVNDGNPMDQKIELENMKELKNFCSSHNIDFFLAFGSLLGAIRDKGFISHDEDVDVGMYKDQYDKIFKYYEDLKARGFRIVRFDINGLVSIMRNGYYIDIYCFEKKEKYFMCYGIKIIPLDLYDQLIEHDFLGINVMIPKNYVKALEYEYGQTWETPIVYTSSQKEITKQRFLAYVSKFIPYKLMGKMRMIKNKKKYLKWKVRYEEYERKNFNNN